MGVVKRLICKVKGHRWAPSRPAPFTCKRCGRAARVWQERDGVPVRALL